ncbi:beta-ketoacyl-[acyl-carrier-protein] synthase family protein [Streptomyces formicae]|uniref:3-oxoacyl-[acyl-carrier-protein] synthase, KASII n=1 Tax=Streptomyces formicae TaxID=1616117 RepID=A0A291QJZ0_9ACTN|nr:beta-ketoacyl-[acyl-carrier-protein] synthase family protein [Streptomyces formicae]ATL31755.1 3-oxoacyl-[acyl-carrier-protein] synthase, KASII [Streptomyces formicae]
MPAERSAARTPGGGTDVWITGYDTFTAFGHGADALREHVFAGRHAFAPVERFDTRPFRNRYAAAHGTDPAPALTETAIDCARGALAAAKLDPATVDAHRAAVLLGTQGDFTGIHRFWQDTAAGRATDQRDAHRSFAGGVPAAVADDLGFAGPRLAFINACVASPSAVAHACRLIEAGRVDVAVVGGGYLVEEEQFAKFDSGRTFARDGRLRPFAKGRSGMLLGDGVAALVLESGAHLLGRGGRPLARVGGYGASADAHHVVKPHPEGLGMARAVVRALDRARLGPTAIDYVNAHGTGTELNDLAETAALHTAFGTHAGRLMVSSTKSVTGHMLEATGAVELVVSVMALESGAVPPTAGFDAPDPRCDLDWVPNEPRRADLRRVLSLNAAFGGMNTAIILEQP